MPTLTGRFIHGDGSPRIGTVRFNPVVTVVGEGNIILPTPLAVRLVDGSFSVELVATDDPLYAPVGWLWQITEDLPDGRNPWTFELTAAADLSALSPAMPPEAYFLYVALGDDAAVLGSDSAPGAGYRLTSDATGGTGWELPTEGVTNHGLLTGLADDDHTQYHTDARGDARYAGTGHSHAPGTPAAHAHAAADVTGTAVLTGDARLSDPRTPTAHKASHSTGGADALTASDIGAAPSLGADDNYVTDAEKTKLANLSGTNTGDQTLPTWSTIAGKPAVVAEGATAATARTAIGAGTSSLALGTSAGSAAEGNDSRITGAVQGTLVDAKGDLIVATAADTVARLPVGATTGHVLTVDPAEAAGVKWATAAAGAGLPTVAVNQYITTPANGSPNNQAHASIGNGNAYLGQIMVPEPMTVDQVGFRLDSQSTGVPIGAALYKWDGTALALVGYLGTVTTSGTTATTYTLTVASPLALTAGVHYIALAAIGAVNYRCYFGSNDAIRSHNSNFAYAITDKLLVQWAELSLADVTAWPSTIAVSLMRTLQGPNGNPLMALRRSA